jgi:hypothetical protein
VEARAGRRLLYWVIGVGLAAALFFGVAMWRHWMDDDLAVFLLSAVLAVVLLLRWTLLRRYGPALARRVG